MHPAQHSNLCNVERKWECLTWQHADRSLCWGVQPPSIKASFQASSLVCLRTSLIKAAANMCQSYLGNAVVPNKNLLGLKSCVVLEIGSDFFIVEPKSPNHQLPSLSTKNYLPGRTLIAQQLVFWPLCRKKPCTGCDATKGTCNNLTFTSMWTKPSAWTCWMVCIMRFMSLTSSCSSAANCISIDPAYRGMTTAAYTPG